MTDHRARVILRGAVQGVGFRPFVHRLATSMELRGWVSNGPHGVSVEVEGPRERLDEFVLRLGKEKPPRASIQSLETSWLEPAGYGGFEIRASGGTGAPSALILPDIATCPDCLRDIFDPSNRRHRYPFTNCTNCGPRFSILEALPYDRPNTSMRRFAMCSDCEREYRNPRDRRFHAQPIACPRCGPHAELWDAAGAVAATGDEAVAAAGAAVREGRVLALLGIGGFQLLVDARDEEAVRALRRRKHREQKPLALLYPDTGLVRRDCVVGPLEERLLESPEAPIVLLERRPGTGAIAPSVAPGNPRLGAMLPCSPLHHLLLRGLGFPVVATSGNLSDEPLCTDPREALNRLCGVADWFLVHDRPIVRPIDDSVARVLLGREQLLRRARGYAPLPVPVRDFLPPVLGVGAHFKNTVALGAGRSVFLSQHLGDLSTPAAHAAFVQAAADLPRLYGVEPGLLAHDMHPDYLSTRFAEESGLPVVAVQHHHAHVLACLADNGLEPPALGVAWDGTGMGLDGTIWGGEFLAADEDSFTRVAHLHPFRLPGGEAAIRQPRRCAFGALHEAAPGKLFADPAAPPLCHFRAAEIRTLRRMLETGTNAPRTTSAGRLFDAAASLAGLRQVADFEGQAAMDLEFAIDAEIAGAYPFAVGGRAPWVVDWRPALAAMLDDARAGRPAGVLAAMFHNTLAAMVLAVARLAGRRRVVLTGGCFQNRRLTELCVRRLEEAGFHPAWHQRVPPNDGAIALGQVLAAARTRRAAP